MTQKTTTILKYQGLLNFEKIEEILTQFNDVIRQYEVDEVIRRRIFSILVESLENTFRHNALIKSKTKHPSVEFILVDKSDEIEIRLGNYILNTNIAAFKEKIDGVNALDRNELNKLYRESIAKARISEKGGAGLGIIEIARNSRQLLKCEFDASEGEHTFFNLVISVKKQQ